MSISVARTPQVSSDSDHFSTQESTATLLRTLSRSTSLTHEHKKQPLLTFKLQRKDVERVIYGSPAFAGGGGGAKKYGRYFLNACVPDSEGTICETVSMDQLQEDDLVIPVAVMGSPDSLGDESKGYTQFLSPLCVAARDSWSACEDNAGSMKYVISVEVGGTNNIVPMFVANASNSEISSPDQKVIVVDGDLQGRAVQALNMLGPYQYGLSTAGSCFSYICKEDGEGPCPEGPAGSTILYHKQIVVTTPQGVSTKYWILGGAVPNTVKQAQDLEAYLSNVIRNYSHPKTVIAVAFGGLKSGDLLKHGSGSNVQRICTPNTTHRCWSVGKQLIQGRESSTCGDVFAPLQKEGAYLIGTGAFLGIITGAAGNARSDIGKWTVRMSGSQTLTCFFNNENVVIGEETQLAEVEGEFTSVFTPITAAPNSICLQAINDVLHPNPKNPNDKYLVRSGECFSNDELTMMQEHFPNGNVPLYVNVFACPPDALNLTEEGMRNVGPNMWNIASGFPKVRGLQNLEYIPCVTAYVEPEPRRLPAPNSPREDQQSIIVDKQQ